MLKKFALALPLVVLSGAVFAADDARTSINITAEIPSKIFHAMPRDPNFGKDERMTYSLINGTLSNVQATYDVRHTMGWVEAYIDGGPAVLFNGDTTKNIPLTTTFNGVVLTGTPKKVVEDDESNGGTTAQLVVSAAKPTNDQVGNYSGNFTVIFDAVPRV
ncbi:CS1 type fimbrial major subunit [Pseudomonas sp.]|uniref:CS1 type fimbrial major subunit n=1 Tax=Pseudomonas sp. TaxID=306 RepID=UPI002E37BB44|nr:CS1 type fimbrial major subunit [Pseudomonas sp.]HEX4551843.1 CS1 type fimbrial major subunit [Pseudomonas sp.]